jgi:hypothetical protein
MNLEQFNPSDTLNQLKDFQRRTVEYVFDQLYTSGSTNKFLVADEAGLGKTWVAAGVVAKAIKHLYNQIPRPRIDIVYICSNLSIANQNISRLNVLKDDRFNRPATRLTYLIIDTNSSEENGMSYGVGRSFDKEINFISFTPGTTLEIKRRSGLADERAILYHLLKDENWNTNNFLKKMLKCTIGTDERWQEILDGYSRVKFHDKIANKFRAQILNDHDLQLELALVSRTYDPDADMGGHRDEYAIIGNFRERLAKHCVEALEPDLIILDEFQRFRSLLDPENPTAELAQEIFNAKDAKVLLLSATPYKMYTLTDSEDDNHYRDFFQTLDFLYSDSEDLIVVKSLMKRRRSLFQVSAKKEELHRNTELLQKKLIEVMTRTERVPLTKTHDSMIISKVLKPSIQPNDIQSAFILERISKHVVAPGSLEYWKSVPYPVNFLKNYSIRRKMEASEGKNRSQLMKQLRDAKRFLISEEQIDQYKPLSLNHPCIRDLVQEIVENEYHHLLWVPPSMPYAQPSGVFRDKDNFRKHLIFSAWDAVPDSIASTISYEVERAMVANHPPAHNYQWHASRLLEFKRNSTNGRLAGMPVLALMLPSPFLAELVDPLELAIENTNGEPLSQQSLREKVGEIIFPLLQKLPDGSGSIASDQRWYWVAPFLFDENKNILEWCLDSNQLSTINDDKGKQFPEHVAYLAHIIEHPEELGGKPEDLLEVLINISIGAPGTCALRTLKRMISTEHVWDDFEILTASARIGWGFRSLFNQPQVIAYLQGLDNEKYWRKTLLYSIDGNIQSMLDEFVHSLIESEGVLLDSDSKKLSIIAGHIQNVLAGFESSRVTVDIFNPKFKYFHIKPKRIRSRYAMRFGKVDDVSNRVIRADLVRDAFNSPFKPFILASTSIGQEGLDFHTYCHSVIHWNLPSNPVDLEQREGRVHRYKGHAIRKNIANDFGLIELLNWNGGGDPWDFIFKTAKTKLKENGLPDTDMIPFWIYEGKNKPVSVERITVQLPYSREISQINDLLKRLATYRVVFGQPRQEDLLNHILNSNITTNDLQDLMISLEPPALT